MSEFTETLERKLADDAGLYLAVEEDAGTLVLSGMIDSDNQRLAALDIAGEVAPGVQVQDNMEIDGVEPRNAGGVEISETEAGPFPGAEPDTEEAEAIEPGDFSDQPEFTDPVAASGAGAAELGPDIASTGDVAYVPPTDPVATDREVVGGFQASADDEISENTGWGDEALADEAREALRNDSATTDLEIDVEVLNRVARLRGVVPTIDDSDLAANVVSRVPGITDVVDELEVEAGRIL